MPRKSTLQTRLEEARRDKGVPIAEARRDLQRITGFTRAAMTYWWRGPAQSMRGEALLLTADYFGVNPRWLANGEGPKAPGANGPGALTGADIASVLQAAQAMDKPTRELWIRIGKVLVI